MSTGDQSFEIASSVEQRRVIRSARPAISLEVPDALE